MFGDAQLKTQLTGGLNGPASPFSQLTPLARTFSASSMSFPRGSLGATGPQFGGISLTANKRHEGDRYVNMKASHNMDELSSRLRQMRTQIEHSKKQLLKRSSIRHQSRYRHHQHRQVPLRKRHKPKSIKNKMTSIPGNDGTGC